MAVVAAVVAAVAVVAVLAVGIAAAEVAEVALEAGVLWIPDILFLTEAVWLELLKMVQVKYILTGRAETRPA